jgi:hypothetical protein
VVLHEYARLGRSVLGWDLLLISGLAMFILGVWLAGRAPARFRLCLARLHDRGAICLGEKPLDALIDELEDQADRWARVFAVVISLAMLAAFAVALWKEFWPPRALLGVIEAVMGYVAGGYLGRMAFYGQLGWLLRKRRVAVIVDPWHADHVGGLKPIGDFFFMQAMVIAVPAAFFAAWLLLIPVWPRDYGHWQEPYFGLLSIAVVIQALAFLWPLWSFHAVMVEEKNSWRSDVDRLYRGHAARRKALLEPSTPEAKKALKEALDIVEDQYIAVQRMPTWPVDIRLRLRFAVNNVILVLPLVTDLLREGLDWPSFLEFLGKIAT